MEQPAPVGGDAKGEVAGTPVPPLSPPARAPRNGALGRPRGL